MTDTATPSAVAAAAHDAGDQARTLAETGKEEVVNVASEVKAQTSKLAGDAGSKVRERADSQLGVAASLLGDMSDELELMASSTSAGSSLASLARDGATMTRQLSDRLQQGGLDGATRDVQMFARRRPVMFLAGAFAIGMMAGRVMRNVDMAAVTPDNAAPANATPDGGNGRSNGAMGDWAPTQDPISGEPV